MVLQKIANHIDMAILAGQVKRCLSFVVCGLQICTMARHKVLNYMKVTLQDGPVKRRISSVVRGLQICIMRR